MAGRDEYRIFVGGLSWDITDRQLEDAFSRFGKVLEAQVMTERDTGRPRGFGFLTFADRRAMEDAIRDMHGRKFGEREISVNKAQPRGNDDLDHRYGGGGYPSGGRVAYRSGDRPSGQDDCFKCGRPGHWARDCPMAGGGRDGGGGRLSSGSRFGGASDRGDRFGGDRDRYVYDHYDGGRYGDRERFDNRDSKYGNRDRYGNDRNDRYESSRYPSGGDRFAGDRYGGSDRYPQNAYGRERGLDRDAGPRGGADRYRNGGPARNEGRAYRGRPGPYDRPARGGRQSPLDRY
ncbi:RNA recognition motif domain [Dillenia turbinata]|uniref:RNA recognition motif domain n=1 Tax=Dillenia turbinata TaxID=194707 RepID=A0AAN8VPJ1_9MAGN